jgi:hypothetical protein
MKGFIMKTFYHLFRIVIFLSIIGCATVPEVRVVQPWTRSQTSTETIPIGAKMKIDITGNTLPLLGNENITSEKIQDKVTYLMERRGFKIDSSNDYVVRCYYKTERVEKFRLSSYLSTSSGSIAALATKSISGASYGLGVSAARTVGAFLSKSSTVANQTAEKTVAFTHTISIDILNNTGKLVWKGESTWDSEELNILRGILPILQLIMSDLPSDQSFKPEIPEVGKFHTNNYYRLECSNIWFACPALPYRIRFLASETTINDRKALAAYVDLIQTAEYALPQGDESDWSDPT